MYKKYINSVDNYIEFAEKYSNIIKNKYPEIKVGDVVTILGEEGGQKITPQVWSDLSGSIPWEVLCGFKNRLPRLII